MSTPLLEGGYSAAYVTPPAFPANPIPEPTSKVGKDALKLYEAARAAAGRLRELRDAFTAAVNAVAEAREALGREVEREGREGKPEPDRKLVLAQAIREREILADRVMYERAQEAARQEHQAAINRWRSFVADHLADLIGAELAEDCERVATELGEKLDEVRPVKARHDELGGRVQTLLLVSDASGYEDWQKRESEDYFVIPPRIRPALPLDERRCEPAREAPETSTIESEGDAPPTSGTTLPVL